MTLQDLGNIGEFVAAIGVIASLVYLAVQIRQNTNSVRLQVQQTMKRDSWDLRRSVIENPEVADLFAKAIADFDSLSASERIRINMSCASVFEHLQHLFLLRNEGLIHWESQENELRGYLAQASFRHWWSSGREILRPQFVEYVEREILPTVAGGKTHWEP